MRCDAMRCGAVQRTRGPRRGAGRDSCALRFTAIMLYNVWVGGGGSVDAACACACTYYVVRVPVCVCV